MATDPNAATIEGFVNWLESPEGQAAMKVSAAARMAGEVAHGRTAVMNPPAQVVSGPPASRMTQQGFHS